MSLVEQVVSQIVESSILLTLLLTLCMDWIWNGFPLERNVVIWYITCSLTFIGSGVSAKTVFPVKALHHD